MTKDALERAKKTDEDRLQIKKIKKAKVASKVYGTLAMIHATIAAASALATIFSLVCGIKGKYYCDSRLITYGAAVLSAIISALAAIELPEICRLRDERKGEAIFLEEELYNCEEIGNRSVKNGK